VDDRAVEVGEKDGAGRHFFVDFPFFFSSSTLDLENDQKKQLQVFSSSSFLQRKSARETGDNSTERVRQSKPSS
jgi:hypothetical protein